MSMSLDDNHVIMLTSLQHRSIVSYFEIVKKVFREEFMTTTRVYAFTRCDNDLLFLGFVNDSSSVHLYRKTCDNLTLIWVSQLNTFLTFVSKEKL